MLKPTKTTDYAKRSRNPSLEQASESSKPQKNQKLRANAASGSSQVPDSASFGDATEASKSQETVGTLSMVVLHIYNSQLLTHISILVPIPTNASSPKVPCPLDNCDRLYTPYATARADHIKRWHRLRTCDICSLSAPVGDYGLGHHKRERHAPILCQCGEVLAGLNTLDSVHSTAAARAATRNTAAALRSASTPRRYTSRSCAPAVERTSKAKPTSTHTSAPMAISAGSTAAATAAARSILLRADYPATTRIYTIRFRALAADSNLLAKRTSTLTSDPFIATSAGLTAAARAAACSMLVRVLYPYTRSIMQALAR
jgi:hypothetical protein